jgi:hypothetical protein
MQMVGCATTGRLSRVDELNAVAVATVLSGTTRLFFVETGQQSLASGIGNDAPTRPRRTV